MQVGDNYNSTIAAINSPRFWNYGPASFDRTHTLVVNWVWDVPNSSKSWNNAVSCWVLDNWQVSGIAAFVSGLPRGVSMTLSDGADLTGGGDGATALLLAPAILPKGERTFSRYFNTSAFARPPLGNFGSGAPCHAMRSAVPESTTGT